MRAAHEEDAANPPEPPAPDGEAELGDPAGAEEGGNAEGGAYNMMKYQVEAGAIVLLFIHHPSF